MTTETARRPSEPRPGETAAPSAAVVVRVVRAYEAMRTHRGAMAGEAWDRKLAEWRSAFGAMRRHGLSLIWEEERDA